MITFKVYANMTRYEWAYPSGTEHPINQWISGQTMALATVIMNKVYLVTETRCRVGEPGINDPSVKLVVTAATYSILWLLQDNNILDPSVLATRSTTVVANATDVHLPLRNVCMLQARGLQGFAIFAFISVFCLSFVIFGTSTQSLSGLKRECGCCCGGQAADKAGATLDPMMSFPVGIPAPAASASPSDVGARMRMDSRMSISTIVSTSYARNSVMSVAGRSIPLPEVPRLNDRIQGQIALFVIFESIVVVIVILFTVTPFYSYSRQEGYDGPRYEPWREACDQVDQAKLDLWGLS